MRVCGWIHHRYWLILDITYSRNWRTCVKFARSMLPRGLVSTVHYYRVSWPGHSLMRCCCCCCCTTSAAWPISGKHIGSRGSTAQVYLVYVYSIYTVSARMCAMCLMPRPDTLCMCHICRGHRGVHQLESARWTIHSTAVYCVCSCSLSLVALIMKRDCGTCDVCSTVP